MVVNLSDIQREILGILTITGSLTLEQLSKQLKLKPHNVRYQLKLLLEAGRASRGILINQRALGYQVFNIFFDVARSKTSKVLDFARRRPEVGWLCQNIGSRRFEMTIIERDYCGVSGFLRALGDETGGALRNPVFTVEGEVRHWGLRFLAKVSSPTPTVFFPTPRELTEVDDLDRRIMNILRSGENSSVLQIGAALGAATSTVKYRLERLKKAGVLSDELYFVKSNGDFLQGQLLLALRSRSTENEVHVLGLCSTNLHVEALISGVGGWDFKIVFQGESMRHLIDVQDGLLSELGNIVDRSETLIRDKILWVAPGVPWAKPHESRSLVAVHGGRGWLLGGSGQGNDY
jgi:DNA-binding Lrp family transcriptional regulator